MQTYNNKSLSIFKPLLLGSLVFLSACGILRPYEQPQLSHEQAQNLYRDVPTNAGRPLADVHWKQLFTDPKLQHLIEQGIANNLDHQNALLAVAQAEAAFKQSRLALLPSLLATPQVTHNKTSQEALNFPPGVNIRLKTTTVQLGVSTNWELDVWGKLASARRAARATLFQTKAMQQALQTSIIANIAQLYYNLQALDEQLNITKSTIALRNKQVTTIKALKEAAVTTGAAVVQSEANLYAAEVSIPDIEQNIRETENALSILIGTPPMSIERTPLGTYQMAFDLNVGVATSILSKRPDVMEAEWNYRNKFENVNVAKAQFYPSIGLTSASFGISALSHNNLFGNSVFYNVVAGLTQPIFNRGVIRANHKIAQAQQAQAWNSFQKALLTAGLEVSNAYWRYTYAIQKESTRMKQIEALQKAVDYNMQLLQYSSATNYTDVLTSEQALLAAQLSSVNDKLQKHSAVIELYRALGGGWQE